MSLKELAEKTGDEIAIHYVSLDDLQDTFLDGNSKNHETTKIIESIRRYGFRDPIAFDPALNDNNGGIIEGNGRLESLIEMRSQGMNLPRGLKEGWLVPVIFGVNATSEAEAVAFSIEHNWSVMWGSDLELDQITSMFDDSALKEQLEWLNTDNSLPISIDNDLDELLERLEEKNVNSTIPDDDEWGFIGEKLSDKDKFQQMTFTLSDNQAFLVKSAISQCENQESEENQNKNGNAITFICNFFLENVNS